MMIFHMVQWCEHLRILWIFAVCEWKKLLSTLRWQLMQVDHIRFSLWYMGWALALLRNVRLRSYRVMHVLLIMSLKIQWIMVVPLPMSSEPSLPWCHKPCQVNPLLLRKALLLSYLINQMTNLICTQTNIIKWEIIAVLIYWYLHQRSLFFWYHLLKHSLPLFL